MNESSADHRLPRNVVPRHYDLSLEPDLETRSFAGTVTVDVEVHEPTSTLILNSAELEVDSVTVTAEGPDRICEAWLDDISERLTVGVSPPLEPGAARLTIAFTGSLNDKLRGFYHSTFTDAEGTQHTIATTQFESTNARRAFPCWDEPDLKATFDVELIVPRGLLAISSGPEIERADLGDGRTSVVFGTTMAMSTYLLAFVVGPLEATDAVDVDGTELRIVHPIGKGHLADFALRAGEFSLRHFSDYFAIPYPDRKLDMVAIPDFAFGAMENQGCATFREILLLLDPETSTQPEKQRAVDVIAHEISHMWFGNLVTMRWWNGIWLKEAFATFCETHACAAYRPEWEPWTNFALAKSSAFDIDALESTRPIEFEVISPEDAEAMYDVLTYEKGGAVVRMLEQYLGDEVFRAGIRSYLDRHRLANTETTDLWDSIEASSGEPVRRMMDGWIFKGGHPLVSVRRTDDHTIRLAQQPFRFGTAGSDAIWDVPIVIRTHQDGTSRTQSVLLEQSEQSFDVGSFGHVVVNAGGSGFYRVAYTDDLLDALVEYGNDLSAVERYALVDDAWALFVAGHSTVDTPLSILRSLGAEESDLAVWRRILSVLASVEHHLVGEACRRFASSAIDFLHTAHERLRAAPGDEPLIDQTRAAVFRQLGQLGHRRSIDEARSLRRGASPGADPENMAAAVNIVAAHGTSSDFSAFVASYENAPTPQEERRYLFALAEFPGQDETAALLRMIDDGQVRTQDAAFVLGHGLANKSCGEQVWHHVETNWEELVDRLPSNSIPRLIAGVTNLADETAASTVRRFFDDHQVPQAGKTLDQHLERMTINVEVRRRIRDQLS